MNKENQKQSLSFQQRLGLWAGLLAFGILSWSIWAWPWQKQEERYDVKRATERAEHLKILREEDAKILGGYAWQDAKAKVVRIPIKEAMRLAVDRLNKKPVQKGSLIAAAISGSASNNVSNPLRVTNNMPETGVLQRVQTTGVSNLATNSMSTNMSRTNQTIRSSATTKGTSTDSTNSINNTKTGTTRADTKTQKADVKRRSESDKNRSADPRTGKSSPADKASAKK